MLTLLLLTVIYFLPTIIVSRRGHAAGGFAVLNLFFGWTGIGWLALLLWALLSAPRWCYYGAPHPYSPYPPAYSPYDWRRY